MKKNILITGGAGNLGASLAKKLLLNKDFNIVVVDNLLTGKRNKLPDNKNGMFTFYEADANNLDDMSKIMGNHHFNIVIHYAAVVGVTRTLENPLLVLDDVDGIKNILKLSVSNNVERVFFSSSSEVYGEPVEIPQNEATTPLNSKLPYAIVKNIGESYFKSFKKVYDLDYTIMRFFNTFGPLQSDDFVIPRFIKQAQANKDITINGDGLQTRTFLYIDDNVDIISSIIERNICLNTTINIGNDSEITILDLAILIINILDSSSKIIHLGPLKEGDMARRKPDISRLKNIHDKNLIPLEEGIKKYLEFIQ
jgi:UDP-glucuronate decarboxylase